MRLWGTAPARSLGERDRGRRLVWGDGRLQRRPNARSSGRLRSALALVQSAQNQLPDEEAASAIAVWMRLADEALGGRVTDVMRPTGDTAHPPVLVVEDDAALRESIMVALCEAGIPCHGAPDGTAALATCQRNDPDVIVLDLGLPGLDGARFADAYRRIPGSSGRIIVISGNDKAGETAARIRATAVLSKPFAMSRLVALTEQFLKAA
jgi:CheY-like chemotaxis protein